MSTFVRVAHRQGWEVEVIRHAGEVETETFASREEAITHAQSLDPEWIEVGDIVGLGTPAQQHSWTTLRRRANGSYAPSALKWQAKRDD
ncbi:hypothetical protein EPN29_10710 [bacterium]|nr:MAG: hypothetical protein EPN29_10710 [bacterium]